MNNHIQEPNATEIIRLASIVQKQFDPKWIYDEIQKNNNPLEKNLITHSYLYSPKAHPIIGLFIAVEQWREECLRTGKFALSQDVLRLFTLGSALEAAQNQKHFERICSRLRTPEQFYAAEFELEVAKSYRNRGYSVEFIEEGKNKSPDLFVTGNNGKSFYVECKSKNPTERDGIQQKIVKQVEQRIIKYLGINKLNFSIIFNLDTDLKFTDVELLSKFVTEILYNQKFKTGEEKNFNYSNQIKILLQNLAPHNSEIDTNGLSVNFSTDPIHLTTLSETKIDEEGKIKIRNPKIIGFLSSKPSDKISGLLKSFHKAVSQLPREGPGVIWIRIPDGMWSPDMENSYLQATKMIEKELNGEKNRRVNAVIIITKFFRKLEKDNMEGLSYSPVKKLILHKNPRNPIS